MAFRKPESKKVGIKVLVWGKKGSGKSRFLLTFPSIAAIDAEAGLAFYEGKEVGKNLVLVSNTQSFKELEDDMDTIGEEHEELKVKTLGIDSETKIYENIQETVMTVEEKRARAAGRDVDDTNLSQRSWGRIKHVGKKLQNLKIDLSSKGVNVVSIAQHDDVKEKKGDQFVVTGGKAVMAKGADYDYDVVLYLYTETDRKGNVKYLGRVDKDRTDTFKAGHIIENPTYDLWKDEVENKDKKKALDTGFAKEQETSKDKYENAIKEDESSMQEKITKLIADMNSNGDKENKVKFMESIKKAKITKFEGLTAKQQENLKVIYDEYRALVQG